MLKINLLSNHAGSRSSLRVWRSPKHSVVWLTTLLITLISPRVALAQTSGINNIAKPGLQSQYQEELDRWMLQAYEGDRDAQFKVGVLFTNDQFSSADFEQAVYWYKQAARQGHALAQYNLGHQYLTGSGIKRNETEAMKWWLKAAQQDHPLAQFNVGRGYYLGIGLAEDHSQSQYWFKRAAQNQEPKSIEILEQLGWAKPGEYLKPSASAKNVKALAATNNSANVAAAPAKPKKQKKESNQLKSIATYTNPAKRSVLIGIIDSRDTLTVVSRTPEWAIVTNQAGFPVWVSTDFIKVNGDKGTILGTSVNARSVPLVANGTIVGQLDMGEIVTVLDRRNDWYRIMSPPRFKAWVKTEDLDRTINPVSDNASTIEASAKAPETEPGVSEAQTGASKTTAISSSNRPSNTLPGTVNDNDWLFSQPVNGYTLQLASFDDPVKIEAFMNRPEFANNPKLHRFTSESKDIVWTYFLYGEFISGESAKIGRDEIHQKLAWVRSFGKLQQSRCLAWKKQIPTPKELNKFCS